MKTLFPCVRFLIKTQLFFLSLLSVLTNAETVARSDWLLLLYGRFFFLKLLNPKPFHAKDTILSALTSWQRKFISCSKVRVFLLADVT